MKKSDKLSITSQRLLIREYYADGVPVSSLMEKYHLTRSTCYRIIRIFASENPQTVAEMKKMKKSPDALTEENEALRQQILRLEKALKQERMRAHAYDVMIDIAEEMFRIPIRKKSGPKP